MADSTTTNYGFTKPEVGASLDTWGAKLNDNWDDADTELQAIEDAKVDKTITLTAGTGPEGGGDLSANRSFAISNTAVSPGTYSLASITVNQQGQITSASAGTINNGNWSGTQLAVINGGTGAASAADARTNLDVYSKSQTTALFQTTVASSSSFGTVKVYLSGGNLYISTT